MTVRHPAKFTDVILDKMLETWPDDCHGPILDPFAGTGKVHLLADQLGLDSFGVELEPEWAKQWPPVCKPCSGTGELDWDTCDFCKGRGRIGRTLDPSGTSLTMVGDALMLPYASESVGCVVTSPCYGNRMADHHEAKDSCKNCEGTGRVWAGACKACDGTGLSRRNTYTHALGRKMTEGSAAVLQWGDEYRAFHEAAWAEVNRVLMPGGYFFLNIKDHIRGGRRQFVSDWHYAVIRRLLSTDLPYGFECVETTGNRQGKNGELRIDYEYVLRFKKRLVPPQPR